MTGSGQRRKGEEGCGQGDTRPPMPLSDWGSEDPRGLELFVTVKHDRGDVGAGTGIFGDFDAHEHQIEVGGLGSELQFDHIAALFGRGGGDFVGRFVVDV